MQKCCFSVIHCPRLMSIHWRPLVFSNNSINITFFCSVLTIESIITPLTVETFMQNIQLMETKDILPYAWNIHGQNCSITIRLWALKRITWTPVPVNHIINKNCVSSPKIKPCIKTYWNCIICTQNTPMT